MKSIGPYVISVTPHGNVVNGHAANQEAETGSARPLTGRRGTDQSAVRSASPGLDEFADSAPLHGVDRLTGMPVLLHRLTEFVVPTAIPASAYLLPVFEVDVWNGHSYAVTELPLAAVPAIYPDSAALGALRGLAALHGAGQIHGGLNAGQLWQIGREVRLAGAGLPWQPEAEADSQALDMKALGRTLDGLGVRPAALTSLETMTAAQALEALQASLADQDRRRGSAPEAPSLSPLLSVQPPPRAALPATPLPAPPAAQTVIPAVSVSEPGHPAPETQATETPVAPSRYRSADDVIVLGEDAAVQGADPLAHSLPDPSPVGSQAPPGDLLNSEAPTPGAARIPIQIGFDEPPAPIPDWTPARTSDKDAPAPSVVRNQPAGPDDEPSRPVGGSPVSNHPDQAGKEPSATSATAVPASARTLPAKAKSPAKVVEASASTSPKTASSTASAGATPADRGQPLRIGWEEDHSWRVVKSGPERRRIPAPKLTTGKPRLVLLALAALVGAGVWYWSSGQGDMSATACCTQSFTVSGISAPVKVTLVQAPPGSSLQPGALIGTAPGALRFQGVPGRYILKFSAAGHSAVNGTLRVPSSQPFGIVLK